MLSSRNGKLWTLDICSDVIWRLATCQEYTNTERAIRLLALFVMICDIVFEMSSTLPMHLEIVFMTSIEISVLHRDIVIEIPVLQREIVEMKLNVSILIVFVSDKGGNARLLRNIVAEFDTAVHVELLAICCIVFTFRPGGTREGGHDKSTGNNDQRCDREA